MDLSIKPGLYKLFYIVIGLLAGALCLFVSPLKAIALVIGVGVIGLIFYNFQAGLCLFIFVVSIVPHEQWNNLYTVLGGVFLAIVYLIKVASGKKEHFEFKAVDFFFLLFGLLVLLSTVTSIAPVDSVRIFLFFGASLFTAFLMANAIQSKKNLNVVLLTVFLAVIATSLLAIYQGIVGVAVNESLTDVELNKGMPGRVYSTMGNPNNYAEYLILFVPFCIAYVLNLKNTVKKLLFSLVLILPVIALGMTYARSAWIGFAIVIFVFLLFTNWRLIPVCVILGIAVVPFLPRSIVNRALTIGSLQDSSNAFRIYIWQGVLKMLKDYWTTGIGLGPTPFSKLYANYTMPEAPTAPHAHMLFLEVWVEMGVVAIISFMWYLIRIVKKSILSAFYVKDRDYKNILIAGVAAIGGISFISLAEYVWFYPRIMFIFWVAMGISMAALKLAAKEE